MKVLLYILALSASIFASPDMSTMANVEACKKCHPVISTEFENSMHKNSSIYDDKVHKAVWDKHPAKAKGKYKCAKCHTPNASTDKQKHKGITCLSCHTIKSVEKSNPSNNNIYTDKVKTFYSAQAGQEDKILKYKTTTTWYGEKTTVGSAYHDIDYTNKNFYNAQVCMGCHSHKQNSHKLEVCFTDDAGAKNKKENCITCHMPQVGGSATTVRISKTHAFHGFAGARVAHRKLAKYVDLTYKKSSNGFEVVVENKAPHNLLTHPLRVVQLRAKLIRDNKTIELKTHTFVRAIGRDSKPSMPWVANEVVKDTMIKAKEKRVVEFDNKLQSGDALELVLGFYVVNPKAVKKLGLDNDEKLKEFTILKSKNFIIK
jgi:DNA-directed RNA polymerase subunit RPC12/RpoP